MSGLLVALRRTSLLGLVLMLTAGLASAAVAQGTGFSMLPDPETTMSLESAYFHYRADAGEQITDAVRIANTTDAPVDLVLYPSDASTSGNGGISFPTTVDGAPEEVGRWLTISEAEVSLESGEVRTVPFTLAVPADVDRGEFTAGIVAQPADSGDAAGGQFSVSVISRTALTVLVTVGDGLQPSLAIDDIRGDVSGDRQIVVIDLTNDGEAGFRSSGSLSLEDQDGGTTVDLAFTLGYFVPGDSIAFRLPLVPPVEPGDYSAIVRVEYEDLAVEHSESISLEPAEDDGIVIEAGDEIVIEEDGGLPVAVLLLIVAAGLLLVGLVVLQTLRLRRMRRRSLEPSSER